MAQKKIVVVLIMVFSCLMCGSVFAMSQDEAKSFLSKNYMPFGTDAMNFTYFSGSVMMGRNEVAKAWLDAGFDINTIGQNGYTALMLSASSGNSSAVQYLLEQGSNVVLTDTAGNTALMLACQNGNVVVIKQLLQAGSDINAQNNLGYTPLITAIFGGKDDVVDLLISSGANVNLLTKKNNNALMEATTKNDMAICEKLITAGINVNVKNNQGLTPLMMAKSWGNQDLIKLLQSAGQANKKMDNNSTDMLSKSTKPILDDKSADKIRVDSIINTKIKRVQDDFDGSYMYYVKDTETASIFSLEVSTITTRFNIAYPSKQRNFVLAFSGDESLYAIDPYIRMKIDGVVWNISTSPENTSYNGDFREVKAIFAITDELYDALMKAKSDIVVRFSYNEIGGNYGKEYKIPMKIIQEMQKMYIICN